MTHQSRPSEILKTSWSKLRVSVIPLKGKICVLVCGDSGSIIVTTITPDHTTTPSLYCLSNSSTRLYCRMLVNKWHMTL